SARQNLADERGGVEDETDTLIAELGGSRKAESLLEQLAERFDHDVLLADESIDDEPDTTFADRCDDDVTPRSSRTNGRRWRRLGVLVEPHPGAYAVQLKDLREPRDRERLT